jgi:hypothetical protein
MPYCITLRSRTDANITGWYAGRNTRWSTDQTRQRRFGTLLDAGIVCHELRSLYPRNAEVINIEVTQDVPRLGGAAPKDRRSLRPERRSSQL